MASGTIAGGGVSKVSDRGNKSQNRSKPMTAARQDRSIPLVSPSNSLGSEDNHHHQMMKISLSSISKLEARNLKRKLQAELNEVRSLIKRLEPQDNNITGDFRLGLPETTPVVPNKKLKSGNGGNKKGGQGGAADKGRVQILKKCDNLLTRLMKHKVGWIFNTPVDAKRLGLHDYHTIVKKPMDLGTVKSKLGMSEYKSPLEFAEDVRLTFNNAMLYNPKGHEVHHMAELLLKIFEEKWAPLETQYESLNRKQQPVRDIRFNAPPVLTDIPYVEPMPLPASTPSPSPPPPIVVENRTLERAESMTNPVEPAEISVVPEKPVEEVSRSRDLTFDEKRGLSEDLQDLPYDKLEAVVQIIKKSNPELAQHEDEIELDIDSLDRETLWELYRFVNNYKEERGLGSERQAESGQNNLQEPNTLVTGVELSKATEPASPVRHEVNAGGSSSSNSSSSGSGSCSSDSDSDSSGHASGN